MKRTASKAKGFTLIELAVVIAIIAILAAVAIPRFGNTTATAECSMIKDMASQLTSAESIWTAENAATPSGFDKFVTAGVMPSPVPAGGPTVSLRTFGPQSGKNGACTVAAGLITCDKQFTSYSATYTFGSGGTITWAAAKQGTAPVCQ